MSDDNIIRSSHHSVTIEKGSKNAKARSAHLEEGFNIEEGVAAHEQDEQIFSKQFQFEDAQAHESATNLFVEGAQVLSAAEKIAKLKADVDQINHTLDDQVVQAKGSSTGTTNLPVDTSIVPNLQNIEHGQALKDSKATVTSDEALGTNIQELSGDKGGWENKVTLPVDISSRPRPRGAAALDALKAASARLAKAGVAPTNAQLLAEQENSAQSNGFASTGANKDNLQNIQDMGASGANRATIDGDKSSNNRQSIKDTADKKTDNRAAVGDASLDKSMAAVPGSIPGADNNQSVKDDHSKKNQSLLGEDDGLTDNFAAVQSQALQKHQENVDLDAVRDSLAKMPGNSSPNKNNAALPTQSQKGNNQAALEDSSWGKNSQSVGNDNQLNNQQTVGNDSLLDNVADIDAEKNSTNHAALPHTQNPEKSNTGIAKEHSKTNEQELPNNGLKDNLAQIDSDGLKHNKQALEDPTHGSYSQSLEDEAKSSHHHGAPKDSLQSHLSGREKGDVDHNLSAIPNPGLENNLAQIPTDTHSDNVAEVESAGVGTHREPLPNEHDESDNSDHSTLGAKSNGAGRGEHPSDLSARGRILQTGYSDRKDQPDQGGNPSSVPQSNSGQGRPVAKKLVKKPSKSASNSPGSAPHAQEVPSASDTWAEAFRGRVAAINGQVKSLNKKLDEF